MLFSPQRFRLVCYVAVIKRMSLKARASITADVVKGFSDSKHPKIKVNRKSPDIYFTALFRIDCSKTQRHIPIKEGF